MKASDTRPRAILHGRMRGRAEWNFTRDLLTPRAGTQIFFWNSRPRPMTR